MSRRGESLACTERITLFDDSLPLGSTDTKNSRALRAEGFWTGGVDGFSAAPAASRAVAGSAAVDGISVPCGRLLFQRSRSSPGEQ